MLTSPLRAADPVTLENARAIAPQRFGGPLYLTGELHVNSPGLLECRLRFRVVSNGASVTLIESDPLVLTAGITRIRQILPVLPANIFQGGITEIEVRLISETYDYVLREIPVSLASPGDEPYILLQIRSPLDSDANLEQARNSLSLAYAAPIIGSHTSYSPTIFAEELPEQSLAYCAFDGVVLTAQGFSKMTGRQLDALAEWTRAGGAVCVHLDEETNFEPKHAEFLNTLFRGVNHPSWLLDDQGRLRSPALAEGLLANQSGVGFSIVTGRQPSWESPAWRNAFARFWHLGREQIDLLMKFDPTSPGDREEALRQRTDAAEQLRRQLPYQSFSMYETPPIGRKVFQELRPDDIRIIPGWVLAGVLMAYVLMVGPVDYFLLGWFKKRRWTWLSFPLMTLLLTAGLVGLANAFMGRAMEARAVTIIDVDANGEPVRVNRLEFLFENRSRGFLYRHEATTFSRLDPAYFNVSPQFYSRNGVWRRSGNRWEQSPIENDAPTGPYRGTFPSRYTVAQQVGKWTPQINRTLTFAPEMKLPKIDWSAAAKPGTRSIELPDGRTARVLHVAGEIRDEDQPDVAASQAFPASAAQARIINAAQRRARINYQELGRLITLRASGAAGRSPLGLGRLEDLPLVDPLDPESRAIVIEVREPDGGITFYRQPVRKDHSENSE